MTCSKKDLGNLKKNILICVGTLQTGGTEKHVYQLIKGLDRSKFNIHLWLLEGNRSCNFGDKKIPDDISVPVVPRGILDSVHFLKKYIKQNNIEIAYTTCIETGTPITLFRLLNFNLNLKHIAARRGLYPHTSIKWKFALFIIYTFASRIISNSLKLANHHVPFFKRNVTTVIYNPIEQYSNEHKSKPELLADLIGEENIPPENTIILGTIARLGFEKGIDTLLYSYSQIAKAHPKTILIIIGDGAEKTALVKLCEKLRISDKVFFTGNIENGGYFLKIMDIFILPSRSESFPNALLEAMINKCACIATIVGGIPEIIEHGYNGLLFYPEDISTLSNYITELLNDKILRDKISLNAFTKIMHGNYSMKKNILAFEKEFIST